MESPEKAPDLNPQSSAAGLLQGLGRDKALWIFGLALAIVVYGYELGSFTISIDEEIHSYQPDLWRSWLSQGRWGMALLNYALPPIAAIPFLPTLIFALGLAGSAVMLSSVIVSRREEAFVFVGIFVSSPVWIHVAEFNTLSPGMGISLIAIAVAVILSLRTGGKEFSLAVAAAGFAIGLYQAALFLLALIVLIVCVSNRSFWGAVEKDPNRKRLFLRPLYMLMAAVGFYLLVNWAALKFVGVELAYVDHLMKLNNFRVSFATAAEHTLGSVRGYLLGTKPIYLGWGTGVLLLPWLGALVGIRRSLDPSVDSLRWRFLGIVTFGAAISVVVAPLVVSAGYLPTRALITLPFLCAVLAVNAFQMRFGRRLRLGAFGLAVYLGIWISTTMFYAEAIARQRDNLLAMRIHSRVEDVARQRFGGSIPMVVVGQWHHDSRGPARKVEIFGQSFFEHGGGNAGRTSMYLRLLGLQHIRVLPISTVVDRIEQVKAMPPWPHIGSVALLDDVVVLKFSDFTGQQQLRLQRSAVD